MKIFTIKNAGRLDIRKCYVLVFLLITSYPLAFSQKFNPLTDPSLVLRLDDQSPVYQDSAGTIACTDGNLCGYWGDLSGKGHHARAQVGFNKPVYRSSSLNGKPAIDWVNGVSQQHLSLGQPADLVNLQTTNFTIIFVAAARSASRGCFLMTKGHGTNDVFNIGIFNNRPCILNQSNTGSVVTDNTLFTFGITYDPSVTEVSGLRRYYSNGSCRGSGIGANWTDYTNNFVFGDWAKGSGYSFEGVIYAVYMYDRTLSPYEMFQMETYIRQKYAQTWPGSTSGKIILWDGNSISANDVIVKQVASQMSVPEEAIFNLSWGAKNFTQMFKYSQKDIDSLIPYLPLGKQLISVGWEITNSLGTAATVFQSLKTYGKARQQTGLQFVAGTCLPRCVGVSFETNRLMINDSIRLSTLFDAYADPGSDPVVGTTTGACNTSLYGDGLHPELKADSIISPYFSNILKNLSGSTDNIAPSVPAGLASASVTYNSFTLSWTASTDNVGVVSYEVFKNGVSIGTVATNLMNVSGLAGSTTYAMTVKAKDAAGNTSAASTALNVTTSAAPATVKVACVGNSITAGTYPSLLGTKLGSGYAVTNLGTSGTTLTTWARYPELFTLKPDVIVIKLGTNNAKSDGWMRGTQAQFIKDYYALLDSIKHNLSPTPKIFLVLPTPASTSACSVIGNICGIILENEILHCIKQVAQARNLPIIDAHTPLIPFPSYFPDGVHPNGTGADSLASIIYRAIIGNNLVPTAVITSPVFNQNVNPNSNVTIQVNASDYDGSISKVQFYDGTTLLGEDNSSPYSFVLPNIALGDHDIIVKAIDNKGAVNTDMVHVYAIQYANVCDSVKRRYWLNLGGGASVTTIDTNVAPSGINYIKTGFKGMLGGGNTASYMNGYVCPPTTGNYVFWICTTDDGEFWLSTDDKPANKVRVSYITAQYADENAFFRLATQQSVPIALTAGKKYYYEVLTKGGCCGNWIQLTWKLPNNSFENPMPVFRFSTTKTIVASTDTQAPTVPTGLASASITTTGFTLNWTASTDNVGVSSYEIFKNGVSVGSSISTTFNVSGLTAATSYSMTVKAKDAAGNVSAASTALSVTTLTAPDTQAPTKPTGLKASSITATNFTLSWTASTDNIGVVSYEVFKGATSCGTTTSTSLSVTGLTANTTYAMTMKASDAKGNISAASTALNVTTTAADLGNAESNISVYPNPAHDVININQQCILSVYDINGILQIQKNLTSEQSQVDVSHLPSGIYIIKIETADNLRTGKFIKE